jgi:hypothetical protein
MLAEKFFLVLETLKSNASAEGGIVVTSGAPRIPVSLPRRKMKEVASMAATLLFRMRT